MQTLIRSVLALQNGTLQSVDVLLVDQHIRTVAPAGTIPVAPHQQVIPGEDRLLLPGFVNGHTHSSQVWQRGLIPQLPLELWLANVFDSTPRQLDQFYWGAVSTALDTLLSGGTGLIDHAYVIPGQELETVDALVRGYKAVGIRAVIAPLIQDLPFASGLPKGCLLPQSASPRSAADLLALMEAIIAEFHDPNNGIYIGVGPTGFHRCSDELLAGCGEISDRLNLCYHTHLLETRAQQRLAQERYGISAVQHLQNLGCLTPRTSLAHGVWISEADIALLASVGSTLVHNPVSNLRLGSGLAPVLKCLQAGLNVAIGCDGAASNDAQNMLEAIKLGTILHTVTDSDYENWLTPEQAVQMAAVGGAKAANLGDRTGTLTPGMDADLVLYNLDHPSMLPRTNPLQLLVLGRPTDVVEAAWVRGRQLVDQGQVLTVDTAAMHHHLRYQAFTAKASQVQHHPVEAHYRDVMLNR
ncbi:amidohydrolase [Nodosilinea sp. LEGE 07298]|uniref:amidohydrolase n=1 Tax=Nodosilinea sp. LEGE 07298 TaxID=2777970 RepID=UPI00187E3051|nr:amidohydrolase [Nodosilinea sp. LEGE 07298]MBE9112474.1 amidohydrolase [Nodosilinea sp. LEGE 07298]